VGVEVTDNLERIFRESDFITIHVPKNPQTLNMIGADQIAMMKPTVRLINCARGGIINEDALYEALSKKRVAGAALDVFSSEPPQDLRFAKLDNCIVTPHLGASTEEAQVEVAVEAAEILLDAINGGPIRNAVNAPSTAGAVPPAVSKYADLARRVGTLLSMIAPGNIKDVQVQYRGTIAAPGRRAGDAELRDRPAAEAFRDAAEHGQHARPGQGARDQHRRDQEHRGPGRGVELQRHRRHQPGEADGPRLGVRRDPAADHRDRRLPHRDDAAGHRAGDLQRRPARRHRGGRHVLGHHGINIATMGVGQKLELQKAILAVSLDKEPDAATIEELRKLDFVNELYVCTLD
jgi:hypothetical protein